MKNKKNLTILGIGVANACASGYAISKLASSVPINFFASNTVDKMVPKSMLFVLPAVILVMSICQIIYRLNTMDKPVTKGKLIEDGAFAFVNGILSLLNWGLIYIGFCYTSTNIVNGNYIPVIYIFTALLGVIMMAIYSTFPINTFGSKIGLRTPETMQDKEVWRVSNRFNGFTGFVSGLLLVLLSMYFTVSGFNWVYLLIYVIFVGIFNVYTPLLFAKSALKKM